MKEYINVLTLWAISLLCPIVVQSQTLNPSYLSEMPAATRVLPEIKGKDAEDTIERQMGAFQALRKIIDDMAWGLEKRDLYYRPEKSTPDETRIKNVYWQAYTDLWHKEKDTYGKQYAGDYDHNRDLLHELLSKFFSENFRVLYFKSNKNAGEAYKAFHDKMYATPANNNGSNQPLTESGGPGSKAEFRRCVESGRTLRRCYHESLGNGFEQLFGINPNQPLPVPPGLRMTGDYASPNGFRVIFEPNGATMVCRGVSAPRPYTVEVRDIQTLVTIQNESKPVVFSLRRDGKLSGSGPIRVTGQVAAGSHTQQTMGMTTQQTTRTKELTPLEAQNYPDAQQNGQVFTVRENATELVYGPTGTQTVSDYVTKTTDCNVGFMSPIGASPLPNELVSAGGINPVGVLTSIGAGLGELMKGGNMEEAAKEMLSPAAEKTIAPGLRMNGRYASSTGFTLNFHPESVTFGCGEAEQALEYSVQHIGNKTMLVVKDNAKPVSFQLMPDGSIVGEGTVQVNGRMITGTTDDVNNPFTFAPRVARYEAGRLVTSGSPDNSSAAMITISSTPTSNATATTTSTPAANVGPRGATAGSTTLTISSGLGVANLLAGKALVVLKDSLENVLAQSGVSAQGRSSRVSAWAHACEGSARDAICQQGVNAFRNYFVAKTGFDANGTAIFPNVPSTGTFYLVVDTSRAHHLMWNVRVDLKPGANSIKLDESNTTPIDR